MFSKIKHVFVLLYRLLFRFRGYIKEKKRQRIVGKELMIKQRRYRLDESIYRMNQAKINAIKKLKEK